MMALILGILASFGWFYCAGTLLTRRLTKPFHHPAMAFGLSVAGMTVLFSIVTTWIPIPPPFLLAGGLLFVSMWVMDGRSRFPFPRFKWTPSFIILLTFLVIFAIALLGYPDFSFDTLSYHGIFIDSFAADGQIALPIEPTNWVDHVHLIFPKGVEMVFGLAHALVPYSQGFLQLLIVMGTVGMLGRLSAQSGIHHPWLAGLLFLGFSTTLGLTKAFFVEQTIFFLFLCFLSVLLEQSRPAWLLVLLPLSLSLTKINAVVVVLAAGMVYAWYSKRWKEMAIIAGSGAVGVGLNFLPAMWRGFDILSELKITQAVYYQATPISMAQRLALMSSGMESVIVSVWGVGLAAALYLIWRDNGTRMLATILWVALGAFLLALGLTDLYAYTYTHLSIYVFAFIGLTSLMIARTLELLAKTTSITRHLGTLFIIGIVIAGFYSGFLTLVFLNSGYHFGILNYYDTMNKYIPNTGETTLFFMNNINPIRRGFEKITLYDHTSFSSYEQPPCDFWRDKGITHILFWKFQLNSIQLDHGYPEFFEQSRMEFRDPTCLDVLILEDTIYGIGIGKMIE
ncbi:MAG: hypothetical protein Q8P05_03205 [Candidatus Diapherotrites archaeon]|nr:hypothetical protein [Candidatus Diapherotrites archaeon]